MGMLDRIVKYIDDSDTDDSLEKIYTDFDFSNTLSSIQQEALVEQSQISAIEHSQTRFESQVKVAAEQIVLEAMVDQHPYYKYIEL